MPRIENEEYGKYGEMLGCADWNQTMPGPWYHSNTHYYTHNA